VKFIFATISLILIEPHFLETLNALNKSNSQIYHMMGTVVRKGQLRKSASIDLAHQKNAIYVVDLDSQKFKLLKHV